MRWRLAVVDSSSFFSLIPTLLASAPVCLSLALFILCSLSYDSLNHVLVSACVLVFVYTSAQCTPVHIEKKKWNGHKKVVAIFLRVASIFKWWGWIRIVGHQEIFRWYDIHDIKANLNESFEDKLCSVCTYVVVLPEFHIHEQYTKMDFIVVLLKLKNSVNLY